MSVLVRFTSWFSLFISREENMKSPQAFLPAALFCTVITHPDPHRQLANRKALPVSSAKYLVAYSRAWQLLHNSMSCILRNHGSILTSEFDPRPPWWYGALHTLIQQLRHQKRRSRGRWKLICRRQVWGWKEGLQGSAQSNKVRWSLLYFCTLQLNLTVKICFYKVFD